MTALDAYGNTATGYTGTVRFTSSDPAAVLPAAYTFVSQDQGVHTFTAGVTLNTLGTQTVAVTDSSSSSVAGSAAVAVTLPAPSNLTAVTVSRSEIDLTWSDNSGDETGFLIERSLDGVHWTQIAAVGANVTSYHSTGLKRHTKYYYRVRATSTNTSPATYSPYSNVASATTRS